MKRQTKTNQIIFTFLTTFILLGAFALKTKAQELPEPNFSAMEQWYEIVKWSYEDTGRLKLIIKPKADPPQTHRGFSVRYFDGDGIDIIDINLTQIIGLGYNTPAGQAERVEVSAPSESQLRKVKKVVVYRIRDDGSLVEPPKQQNDAPTERPSIPATRETGTATDETARPIDCSFEKYPEIRANDRFSESLIKSALYERYASQANTGGLTSPGEIGVTFLKIQIGKAYANTVTIVPGRGAQRRQDGAPVDETIYPFKAIYIVCNKYAKETVKKQYESDFVCFKDRTGNWSCPPDGVPKITYPK